MVIRWREWQDQFIAVGRVRSYQNHDPERRIAWFYDPKKGKTIQILHGIAIHYDCYNLVQYLKMNN